MPAFWEGVLAGYGIAVPVGAIAVLIVDVGLRRGFRPAFVAGAGAASADFLYASLAALAGGALAGLLTPFAAPLRVASGLVLCMLGAYGLWQLRRRRRPSESEALRPPAGAALPARIYGQFLGLTLLNPLTVAYFTALILGRGAGGAVTSGARVAFVAGAGLASLSWQTMLAAFGSLAHRRLSPAWRLALSVAGNLVVLGLGVRLLFLLATN